MHYTRERLWRSPCWNPGDHHHPRLPRPAVSRSGELHRSSSRHPDANLKGTRGCGQSRPCPQTRDVHGCSLHKFVRRYGACGTETSDSIHRFHERRVSSGRRGTGAFSSASCKNRRGNVYWAPCPRRTEVRRNGRDGRKFPAPRRSHPSASMTPDS